MNKIMCWGAAVVVLTGCGVAAADAAKTEKPAAAAPAKESIHAETREARVRTL